MRKQPRTYLITIENLASYQQCAMHNAEALLKESTLLFQSGFHARAYFLAEAAIEETGKVAIAYFAKGRNLKSASVQSRLRVEFEDHTAKIRAAFMAYLSGLTSETVVEEVKQVVHYTLGLQRGREAALYSDFRANGSTYWPGEVVKPSVAQDCLMLAVKCNAETKAFLDKHPPVAFTSADDKWFALGPKGMKVWDEEDFGWYLLAELEGRGNTFSLSEAVTTYHDCFLSKGLKFRDG